MMRHFFDSIERRITEPHIGRSHIDFRPQRILAVGELTSSRLRQLAGRVLTVSRMLNGVPFRECWEGLVDEGFRPGGAFSTVMRIFRSGGLTKDACYLRGLLDILAHDGAGGIGDIEAGAEHLGGDGGHYGLMHPGDIGGIQGRDLHGLWKFLCQILALGVGQAIHLVEQ